MVLIRLAYTADLPAPDEIIRALGGGSVARSGTRPAPAAEKRPLVSSAGPSPVDALHDEAPDEPELDDDMGPPATIPAAVPTALPVVRSFADVVALAGERREAKLKVHLEEHVSLVRFDADQIELHLLPGAPKELGNELREKLNAWTGKRWMVALSSTPGERTLGEVARERESAELREIEKHPAVAAVLEQFPEAKISGVRPLRGAKSDDTGTG
jgi:DNA polymerase-3 subunit gamma/tau